MLSTSSALLFKSTETMGHQSRKREKHKGYWWCGKHKLACVLQLPAKINNPYLASHADDNTHVALLVVDVQHTLLAQLLEVELVALIVVRRNRLRVVVHLMRGRHRCHRSNESKSVAKQATQHVGL